MLSPPKNPITPCPDNCGCRVCRDVHVLWARRLNTTDAREWWLSLNQQDQPGPVSNPDPAPPSIDMDMGDRFDVDMAELTARIQPSSNTSEETP